MGVAERNIYSVLRNDKYTLKIKKIYEKIGADVEFVPIISGNYEAKMQVLNATAEQVDIVFVSNWLNNYYSNVAKNTFLPLDDLLKKIGVQVYDPLAIVQKTHGVSYNDFLWIQFRGEHLRWKDVAPRRFRYVET